MTPYLEAAGLFVGGPALIGACFATVAIMLRRRFGVWALLVVTLAAIALAAALARSLDLSGILFALPAIPAIVIAAGVVEWRARRTAGAPLWRDVAWGTAAFVVPAAAGLFATLSACRMCGM